MSDYRDKGHDVEHCDAGLAANLRRPEGEVKRWWHEYWTEQRGFAVMRVAFQEGYDEAVSDINEDYERGYDEGRECGLQDADREAYDEGHDDGYRKAKEEINEEIDHLRTTLRLVGEPSDE